MVKKIIIVFLFNSLIFSACSSSSPPATVQVNAVNSTDFYFWSTGSESGELIFHGVSPVYSNIDDSIKEALEDAARRVAFFKQIEGTIESVTIRGSGFLGGLSETNTSLSYNQDYKQYVEALTFNPEIDVRRYENTIFVRTRYRASLPVQVNYNLLPSYHSSSKPAWVDNPPVISEYIVGIGHAGRQSVHRKTIVDSYESAVFSIINELYSSIDGSSTNYQGRGVFDYANNHDHEIKASGVLHNFYILDTWFDSERRAVWTLAIALRPR